MDSDEEYDFCVDESGSASCSLNRESAYIKKVYKRARTIPECIIHLSLGDPAEGDLTSSKDIESWNTLLNAAKIRNHTILLDVAKDMPDGEVPRIYYHRECRSAFTLKKTLESIKTKKNDQKRVEQSIVRSSCSRSAMDTSACESMTCIFCEKTHKYIKGTRTKEPVTKCNSLQSDGTLRKVALQKMDSKMLAILSQELVAAGGHYHRSCYRNYTNNCNSQSTTKMDESEYKTAEAQAYLSLFSFIRNDIIGNQRTVEMSELISKLTSFMSSLGIHMITQSTKKHIRTKLEKEFGDLLFITTSKSGKLFVSPSSLTKQQLVLENQLLKKQIKDSECENDTKVISIIDQAAAHIRSTIKDNMKETPWPYHPSDVYNNPFKAPDYLERFLLGLLSGKTDQVLSSRIKLLIDSFSQDIVYAVTGGQMKTPKHLLLPYALKTLTGNVEMIRTLNRLGHGVSYTQLEENDTALCLQKLAATANNQVVLPSAIQPSVFTNLAWDNIDRLEETLTGKGTSHRVNGIAVQAKVFGPQLPKPGQPNIEKRKQRTINTGYESLVDYVAGERVGPNPLTTEDTDRQETNKQVDAAKNKNLIWVIARYENVAKQIIPSWTGFNIKIRNLVNVSEDVIGYLPTINAPATELTTVFEIINQSELIRRQLQLQSIVVVMDQALFAKATEIVWKHKDRYANVVLRMGVFHTICNALSILGKRFQDAGLKDLCIESGILAEGSVSGVFDGKMYNRSVRVHKHIYEALMRLVWAEFIPWVEERNQTRKPEINNLLEQVKIVAEDTCQEKLNDLLESPVLTLVKKMWNDFLEYLRCDNGQLSAFWMSYVDMVEDCVLGLLRASREGNWFLHLHSIRALIPWAFAYDKLNYARYLPAYYASMTNLPKDHPDVHEAFKHGSFSVQVSGNNPFARLPVDQTTEVTVNKDTQTPGGTARFSLKSGAVKRYYITAEHRSSFLGQLREMVEQHSSSKHSDLQKPRIQKDEESVSSVVNLVQSWINPFSENQNLVNISTGKTAPTEIANDLMKAHEIGEQNYATFRDERLEKSPAEKEFHEPLKMNKLKTFSDMTRKKVVKSSGRTMILKADRSLFGRMIVTAQVRNIQMSDIFSHPLGPLPWALSTPDGLLRKTNKATLASNLQKHVPVAEQLPVNCATIVDGMALVQRVRGDQDTFGEIARSVFSMAMKEGDSSPRIDVVFDTYCKISIKSSERATRGQDTEMHQLQSITARQIVRQWKEFLMKVSNKSSLVKFLVKEWQKTEYKEKLQDKVLYVTEVEKCYKITSETVEEVPSLFCTQEEADGRLLLHAAQAAREGYQAVVIASEDTDVFVMCLAQYEKIGVPLFQKCGNKARRRIVDVGKVSASVGKDVCRAIIGIHAYTGCDSVSAFAGKGKSSSLKILSANQDVQKTFSALGEEWDISEGLIAKLEYFTCMLYGSKISSVDDLRYNLFCAKKGEIESHQLPPCKDCLIQHMMRANYQAAIWKRCLLQDPKAPSPVGRGWKMEDGHLVLQWMTGQPAPQAVLDLLACNCSRKCELPHCVCLRNNMKCTDMCKLQACANQVTAQDDDESGPQDDIEEDDDL